MYLCKLVKKNKINVFSTKKKKKSQRYLSNITYASENYTHTWNSDNLSVTLWHQESLVHGPVHTVKGLNLNQLI